MKNEVFANTDFTFEAENYISNGMTDREEIGADVVSCFADIDLDADAEDIEEYIDNVMHAITAIMAEREA